MSFPCSTSLLSSSLYKEHTTLLLQDMDVGVAVSVDVNIGDGIGVDIVVVGVDVICVLSCVVFYWVVLCCIVLC